MPAGAALDDAGLAADDERRLPGDVPVRGVPRLPEREVADGLLLVLVRAYASARNVTMDVKRFARTTRTAEDAAREIGTDVARIVKSLVFIAETGGGAPGREATPVIVLCSGQGRVDETLLAAALGTPTVRRATADEAKTLTGYAIGGVPPFAHATACRVFADRALLSFDEVWAAAGLPDAVFAIAPRDLVRISEATVVSLAG